MLLATVGDTFATESQQEMEEAAVLQAVAVPDAHVADVSRDEDSGSDSNDVEFANVKRTKAVA